MKYFLACFFLFCLSCSQSKPAASAQKPSILVSIAPYQFLVERIVGEKYGVQTIVPPGSNPHLYEPTLRQIGALEKGVVWFRIGEGFEQKILPVLQEKNRNLVEADLRQGVSLLSEGGCKCHAEGEDRHIWLSPKSVIGQIHTMVKVLSLQFPEDRDLFFERANQLIQEVKELDREIATLLEGAHSRSFLVSHPAFAYFCKDYQLKQISIEWEGKDPTAKHMTKVLEQAEGEQVKLGIAMPQHSNKGLEIVAEKRQLHVLTLDPYSPHYFETLRTLAQAVANP